MDDYIRKFIDKHNRDKAACDVIEDWSDNIGEWLVDYSRGELAYILSGLCALADEAESKDVALQQAHVSIWREFISDPPKIGDTVIVKSKSTGRLQVWAIKAEDFGEHYLSAYNWTYAPA